MSLSFLVLMGSNNIALVSYAYSISMYCIHLLMVNEKIPVRSVYNFTLSGSAMIISANTEFVVSSLGGKKSISISSSR